MNFLLIALAALLLLGKDKPQEEKKPDLFSEMNNYGILGDGAKNLVDSFSRLKNDGDKTGVIMELISNPIIFNMVKNVLFKDKTEGAGEKAADSGGAADVKKENTYQGGAEKAPEQPAAEQKAKENSEEAKDFFSPVEKVAGIEVSKELYDLYDDWYLEH